MRRLPIENCSDTAQIETADDVLWAEIAVDDHIPFAFEVWNGRGIDRLKDGELPSDESQRSRCVTFGERFLAVPPSNDGQQQGRARSIKLNDLRNRIPPDEVSQASEFPLRPGEGLRTFISLLNSALSSASAVCIAMGQLGHGRNRRRLCPGSQPANGDTPWFSYTHRLGDVTVKSWRFTGTRSPATAMAVRPQHRSGPYSLVQITSRTLHALLDGQRLATIAATVDR